MRSADYGQGLARAAATAPGRPRVALAAAATSTTGETPEAEPTPLQRAGDAIVEFVPTDVVGVYLPAMGLAFPVRDSHPGVAWFVYGAGILLSAFLVGFGYWSARDAASPAPTATTWIRLAAPVLAFSVWGLIVPGLLADPVHTAFFGAIALLISPVLKTILPKAST